MDDLLTYCDLKLSFDSGEYIIRYREESQRVLIVRVRQPNGRATQNKYVYQFLSLFIMSPRLIASCVKKPDAIFNNFLVLNEARTALTMTVLL